MRLNFTALTLAVAFGFGGLAAYAQSSQSAGQPGTSPRQDTASVGQPTGPSTKSSWQAGQGTNDCIATKISLEIGTGDDDLRGGQDNLNIIVRFTKGKPQAALNVNKSRNWPNNSVNFVDINLDRPVPKDEITSLQFIHIADGGVNWDALLASTTPAAPFNISKAFHSQDNWNMSYAKILAVGNGVGTEIGRYGFYRFTGSYPAIVIATPTRRMTCGSDRPGKGTGSGGPSSGGQMPNSGGGVGGNGGIGGGVHSGSGGGLLSRGSGRPTQGPTGGTGASSGASGSGSMNGPNSDVIKMVEAGLPNSAIIASIRSRPGGFDLSNKARADLFAAGEKNLARQMNEIWDAMIAKATNGRGGDSADELSPQPYPPKGSSGNGTNAGNSGGPGAQRSATTDGNSNRGVPTDSSLLPAVRAQAVKTKVVIPPNLKVFTVGEARNPAAPATGSGGSLLRSGDGGNIGLGQTQSAPGSARGTSASWAANRVPTGLTAMQTNTSSKISGARTAIEAACLNRIVVSAVNQKTTGVVFTPGEHYIVTGCGFGSTPGKVYLTGSFPAHNGQLALSPYRPFGSAPGWNTERWSDQRIDTQLDPGLSGEVDEYSASLTVETSTGTRIQFGGSSFSAQREEVMLRQIPSSAFCDGPDYRPTQHHCDATGLVDLGGIESPCHDWVTSNCTVEVLRQYGGAAPYNPSRDYYSVKLKPGFALSRVILEVMSDRAVTAWTTPTINGNEIAVDWAWIPQCGGNCVQSLYGLQIYVVGPLGVDAWASGQ